jgi:sulfoxide reductase catalytic subunit YedY
MSGGGRVWTRRCGRHLSGGPIRLRVEIQLGFKMVKWICAIEVVEDYSHIGEGQGGWHEDNQYYGPEAGI